MKLKRKKGIQDEIRESYKEEEENDKKGKERKEEFKERKDYKVIN